MTTSLREASEADVDTLVEFMRELYKLDQIPFDRRAARRALMRLIKHNSLGRVILICRDNAAVGYLVVTFGYSLEFHGRDAFIDELYVQNAYRGKGVGAKALEFADQVCRSNGVRALHLEVERKNVAAQNFYRNAGFQDHDRFLMTRWIDPTRATKSPN